MLFFSYFFVFFILYIFFFFFFFSSRRRHTRSLCDWSSDVCSSDLQTQGPDRALDFLTGYLIEYSLSVDNIFVFVLIFAYFKVPPISQHRVLVWGIVGALVMRGVMIWLDRKSVV